MHDRGRLQEGISGEGGQEGKEAESVAPSWRENWIWAIWVEKQLLGGRAVGSLYIDCGGEEGGDDAAKEGGVLGDLLTQGGLIGAWIIPPASQRPR